MRWKNIFEILKELVFCRLFLKLTLKKQCFGMNSTADQAAVPTGMTTTPILIIIIIIFSLPSCLLDCYILENKHRFHNQGSSLGRANNSSPRYHRNSVPDEFVKGAGCGWAGRGGRHFSEPELQNHSYNPRCSPSRPVVNARIHPSSPRERPSSMTTHYRQPIRTPSNQAYRPRSPVAGPFRNAQQENPWGVPRQPIGAPLQSFSAPTVNPWIRGNAGPRNSGLENQWRMTASPAAAAPTDNPWIRGNAGTRNSGLENQWHPTSPAAATAPTDPGWVRYRSVYRGGQPGRNNQNTRR